MHTDLNTHLYIYLRYIYTPYPQRRQVPIAMSATAQVPIWGSNGTIGRVGSGRLHSGTLETIKCPSRNYNLGALQPWFPI